MLTVLLVDDDPAMRRMLADFLTRQAFGVVARASGAEALAVLESEAVDVAVLDKEMPEMNGLDVLAHVRRRWPGLPVVIVTAFGGPAVESEARRQGAAAYLEKPFLVQDLVVTLKALAAG